MDDTLLRVEGHHLGGQFDLRVPRQAGFFKRLVKELVGEKTINLRKRSYFDRRVAAKFCSIGYQKDFA